MTGLLPKERTQRFIRRLAAAGILLLSLAGGCQEKGDAQAQPGVAGERLDFPEKGAYTGAYIDFGDSEDAVTLDKIEDFEAMVGKKQGIVASSSYWGEQSFPTKNLQVISEHGAVPMIYWSPWDKPYEQGAGPDRFNLRNILSGMWDAYIDRWADQAKAYGKPILVSWGLEMNGNWFPWSGCYYEGKKRGEPAPGAFHMSGEGAKLYKEAFRYVVKRVKARGASNILWGFHANNFSYPHRTNNSIADYYPGSDVVDWLGLSAYGVQFGGGAWWASFPVVMDDPYQEICRLDPGKPFILAEWGVGEFPALGSKSQWIREAFQSLETKYPRLKGAVFWHERWQNKDESFSNLRVNSSPESLDAYRNGVSSPFWIDAARFRP